MKRTLAVLLSLLMLFGCLPVTGFSVSDGAADGNAAAFMRIVHLDCGRKYFSVEEIKGVIDMAAENLYTHVELAFGNEGLRFLLDDMSVSVNSTPYSSEAVTKAVQTGNRSYTTYSSGELTESEMDTILAYAAEQGISIIPLLNSPGHMNALMDAGEALTGTTMAYNGSARTIDVTNETATAFTLAVLAKYVAYFAEKGCTHFNLGADEYANDKYTTGAMGFGQLQSNGQYDDFIAYVNNAAAVIKEAGMTPMAFNDGIYFNNVTSSGTFDSDIAVCFWTAGWTGYTVASASTLAQKGHKIINTNDNWYYVLGNTAGYYNLSRAQTGTKETACTTVLTDSSGSVTPIGCMLCIWCDSPSVSYTTAEQENISGLLTNLAENNADYFKAPENSGDEVTLTDSATGIAVTADKLQTLTVSPVTPAPVMDGWLHSVAYDVTLTDLSGAPYTGAAEVAIPVPDGWNTAYLRAYVQESDGSYSRIGGAYADGVYTASVPHFSVVALAAIDPTASKTEQITLEVGGTQTITDKDGNYQNAPLDNLNTSIATVEVKGTTTPGETVETTLTSLTTGDTIYVKSANGKYLGDTTTTQINWVDTYQDAVQWTVTAFSNGSYMLEYNNTYVCYPQNGRSFLITSDYTLASSRPLYFNNASLYGNRMDWGLFYTYQNQLGSAVTITETAAVNQTEITFTGVAAGTTSVTIGNTTYKITVAEHVETLLMYVGEETSFADTSMEYTATNKDVVAVQTGDSKIRFTALAAGTTTVTTASGTYTITVIEPNFTAPDYIVADHATTTVLHTRTEITPEQLKNGAYTSTLQVDVGNTDTGHKYIFWKARVIDRSQTEGGQMFEGWHNSNGTIDNGDNECITYDDKAYDIDALKYDISTKQYYFRVADTGDWKLLNYVNYNDHNGSGTAPNYGHQLILYYMISYVDVEDKASINTSDWGGEPKSDRVSIIFQLYEVTNDNYDSAVLLEASEEEHFANGIKVIATINNPDYEVVRSVIDYDNIEDVVYDGQITVIPAVEPKQPCTVKIYIRKKSTFEVKYDWINAPSSETKPSDSTGLKANDSYTVDTKYKSEYTVNDGAYTYTFSGWYLDEDLEKSAPATLTINGDVTLYGQWTRTLNDTITITANSAEKVYDGGALTANDFTVTYQGNDIPRNNDGTYTINAVKVRIVATVSGSQTTVGSSTNIVNVTSITDNEGTEYSHTTKNGTLTVYPKIVVEYYKDSIESTSIGTENFQVEMPENGNPLYNIGDEITLSDEWLNKHKPDDGYQNGVQQEPVPYVIKSDDNKVVIRVLYRPAYTSLTIHKTGADVLDENQTFLFRVTGEGDDVAVTVTVHGNSFVTIDGLTVGEQYTVTEITDWSWRYGAQVFTTTLDAGNYEATATGGITVTLSAEEAKNSVTCTNTRTVPHWLDGDNFCVNVFASSTQN